MAELRKLPLVSLAEVQASSEADGHPILLAFDDGTGPGGTYWKAGDAGEQTITVTFREPCTLAQITMEVEEREVARTQEVQLSLSANGQLQSAGCDVGKGDMESPPRPNHQCAIGHQARQRAHGLFCDSRLTGVVATGMNGLKPVIR